jgi:hypothetical protein
MPRWCACCWSACGDDRAADQHADLDRGGSDGLAARLHGVTPPATNVSNPSTFGVLDAQQTAENAGNRTGQLALRLDF